MKKLVEKSVTKSKEETDDLNGNLETSENEEEWQVSFELFNLHTKKFLFYFELPVTFTGHQRSPQQKHYNPHN